MDEKGRNRKKVTKHYNLHGKAKTAKIENNCNVIGSRFQIKYEGHGCLYFLANRKNLIYLNEDKECQALSNSAKLKNMKRHNSKGRLSEVLKKTHGDRKNYLSTRKKPIICLIP